MPTHVNIRGGGCGGIVKSDERPVYGVSRHDIHASHGVRPRGDGQVSAGSLPVHVV